MLPTWTVIQASTPWQFQGVFTTKEKAIEACKGPNWFIFPYTLDEILPAEPTYPPNYEFPLAKTAEPK